MKQPRKEKRDALRAENHELLMNSRIEIKKKKDVVLEERKRKEIDEFVKRFEIPNQDEDVNEIPEIIVENKVEVNPAIEQMKRQLEEWRNSKRN